ncbi:HPr family phosphocarrier protein [Streptomyces sp. NPDC020362]|uniref:HPr family phosphocarrier protein n=1 Tax=unclassified Streptomyces TaxID=2593676 RepID=UPI000B2296EC
MSTSSDTTTTSATTTTTATTATTTASKHETAVVLPANLHARPAGRLARAAAGFTSAIQLEYADRTVNPTGVLAVMGLGATAGSTVTVRAEGHDAEQAVSTLTEILATAE